VKIIDKRQFPRAQVTFPVDCVAGNLKFHSQAANLGGGGVFVHSPQRLLPDAEIVIQFRPAKHLPVVKVKGKVRFQLPGLGFGVEFQGLSEITRQALLRLIHHRTIGHRNNLRVPLVTQVSFGDGQALALVKDISIGGMFIETRHPPPSGSPIQLRFNLDPDSPVVVAVAHVSYVVKAAGMGVQFVEIQPEDQRRIQAYIDQFFKPDASA
jgi:c-di-GMP-binding flagellar brake protein YcgR